MNLTVDPGYALATLEGMINGFFRLIPSLLLGAVLFTLFYFAAIGLKRVIMRTMHNRGAGMALGRLTQAVMMVIGVLFAAAVAFPSVKPADVLGILGIGSVAVGFAFRDILQNYLAGILILWQEPFKQGDQIETKNGSIGTVEAVETRATTMRTYDGRRVVIPNSTLFTDTVTVNTALEKRRSEYDVGIGYGDDLETARRVILEAIESVDSVATEPAPEVFTWDFAESTVNLRLRWWTDPHQIDVVRARDRVLTAVKQKLAESGIDLPFPTRVLLFHDQTEETDGDRRHQREGWPARPDGHNPKPSRLGHAVLELAESQHKHEDNEAPYRPAALDRRHNR